MKSRTLTCIAAMIIFVALATPVQLIAQKQIRYIVTDLGITASNGLQLL